MIAMKIKYVLMFSLLIFGNLVYSESHKNLQSFNCHSYEDTESCSENCIYYYDQDHSPMRKPGMNEDDETWVFTQFRFHKAMNKLTEQSAYMSRKKQLLPKLFDYTVSSRMNYCRQFKYIDDDNWTCIDEIDEETGKQSLVKMTNGIFVNINKGFFEDADNVKERELNPEHFKKNGSPFLECMKEIPVTFIEYKK